MSASWSHSLSGTVFVESKGLKSHQPGGAAAALLAHPAPQRAGVLIATLLISAMHWQNDGLWFQGDAPRHAANGLFFWDLLTTLPSAPLEYALSYYARYPVITPVAYPPLFHLPEGFLFWLFGPSPHIAKGMVLVFTVLAGFYTTAWARRWIAPLAGWAGACVVLLPGFVRLSNAVLLNVPATALGLAALYHFRRWLETSSTAQLRRFGALAVCTILTYYPGAIILPVALAWLLWSRQRAHSRVFWALVGGLVILVVLTASLVPVYLSRHTVSFELLFDPRRWMGFYARLTAMTGGGWLALGIVGLVAGLMTSRQREAANLGLAYLCVAVSVLLLRWLDIRYFLLLGPITVLLGFIAVVTVIERSGRWHTIAAAGALAAILVLTALLARRAPVPVVSGFDRVAVYLRDHGPRDSVLYRGLYDGVFGYYFRAFDPRFERRLVLWRKILATLDREAFAQSDVARLVRTQSGSRWFALEVASGRTPTNLEVLLSRALAGPEFELVQSFPVIAPGVQRVDLYRFTLPLEPAPPMDLTFGSFSSRVFRSVEPIPTRP